MTIDRAVQITYFLLRVVSGVLFIQFGGLILFGWFGGVPGQPGGDWSLDALLRRQKTERIARPG